MLPALSAYLLVGILVFIGVQVRIAFDPEAPQLSRMGLLDLTLTFLAMTLTWPLVLPYLFLGRDPE